QPVGGDDPGIRRAGDARRTPCCRWRDDLLSPGPGEGRGQVSDYQTVVWSEVTPFRSLKSHGYTETQKEALLDLLVLGMYADRLLASVEDACIQQRLARF